MKILIPFTFFLLTIIFTGCEFNNLSEPVRDSYTDGRNPDVVPEVSNISFASKYTNEGVATLEVLAKAADSIRIQRVNQIGDQITEEYSLLGSGYDIQLSNGPHLVAAQVKSPIGIESTIHYQEVQVELKGREKTFFMGNSRTPIETIWIPAGRFIMGSDSSGEHAWEDEMPEHEVQISKGFWMGKFEVTQSQWESIMGPWEFATENAPNNPAEMMTWNDITEEFLPRLNANDENQYWNLPTEAEWEYACRASYDKSAFWWGNNIDSLSTTAWFDEDWDSPSHEVGLLSPNPWGLYDMLGNVSEWCLDFYDADYYSSRPIPDIDPSGPIEGQRQILRGGSSIYPKYFARPACRKLNDMAIYKRAYIGVRLVIREEI